MSEQSWMARTEMLVGSENLQKLKNAKIIIFGLGGVGGCAIEMLCRAGIGNITIVDGDKVQASNRNRQIPALSSTEGVFKTEVMASRLKDINPDMNLTVIQEYVKDERTCEILDSHYDYVLDAIDTLSPKVHLLQYAMTRNFKLVSSMGAGGKFDPAQVHVCDISESYQCRLAYYIRKRLHKMGIYSGFKVVFSTEVVPRERINLLSGEMNKKSAVGTISYMPAVFGCFMASVVIRDLIEM